MSNYIEYRDKMVFHPGYYIKEIVEESGLTQEDFAKRLGTTPKNLSILIRGEQRLSIDLAMKLSRMLRTSVSFWLNLQCNYDEVQAEILSESELCREREIFQTIDYVYFTDNFALPETEAKDEQIKNVREFLQISSLSVLQQKNMAANSVARLQAYAAKTDALRANIMLQIAVNQTVKTETPPYNKKKFLQAVDFALTQTENENGFYPEIVHTFGDAGVVFVITPYFSNAGIDGAVKIVNGRIMLMMNDQINASDTFWLALFREIGYILTGKYGLVFQDNTLEDDATAFAQEKLIPQVQYESFLGENDMPDENAICEFAKKIGRTPGIVLGRLCRDNIRLYRKSDLIKNLRREYVLEI